MRGRPLRRGYATIRSLEKMRSGLDAAISGLERALEKFGE